MKIGLLLGTTVIALHLLSFGRPNTSQATVVKTELPFAKDLQRVLNALSKHRPGRGVSAAVIVPGQGTWSGVAGHSHPNTPMSADMLFDIASIGKNFVAVLILQLAEEGKLSLEDPLSKWLPDYPHIDNTAAIRQLLNHTSGIFDWVEHPKSPFRVPFSSIDHGTASSPDEVVRTLVSEPYFSPGAGYHYSTTNYCLLRIISEKATGSKVSIELERRFLKPVNLNHTVVLDSDKPIPDNFQIAHNWWDTNGDTVLDDVSSKPITWIATRSPAMVYSTAEDLAMWS